MVVRKVMLSQLRHVLAIQAAYVGLAKSNSSYLFWAAPRHSCGLPAMLDVVVVVVVVVVSVCSLWSLSGNFDPGLPLRSYPAAAAAPPQRPCPAARRWWAHSHG